MADSTPWELREAEAGADDATAAGLMVEYLVWANGRLLKEYAINDPPTDPRGVLDGIGEYHRPRGVLLLAEVGGRPAGVGALRRLGGAVAEVKRIYVVPSWRGRHIGSAIVDRLIDEARGMGATTLRLDTCRFMVDAQRLYRSRGFTERAPYPESEIPPRLHRHWAFFERGLDVAPHAPP